MNLDHFLAHHGITDNPFRAEEARHDPVFDRLKSGEAAHPEFSKIIGRIDEPATSVVFGEKGSGKTAIRLLIGRRIAEHNKAHSDRMVMLVAYDDLNPFLDRLTQSRKGNAQAMLEHLRLADHQDGMLSVAVTRLVDGLLKQSGPANDEEPTMPLPDDVLKRLRKAPRRLRVDLAVLAALYDRPRSGSAVSRFDVLSRHLRLGWQLPMQWLWLLATILSVIAVGLLTTHYLVTDGPWWLLPAMVLAIAGAVLGWVGWAWYGAKLWVLSQKLTKAMPALGHTPKELRAMLTRLSHSDRANQPWPTAKTRPAPGEAGPSEPRYRLTGRLIEVLAQLNTVGLHVLVDRMDEPTIISGDPEKMKQLVWPMLDNKFLQQRGMGIKLLLPIELSHAVKRESAAFFQEARLDKQNLVERLSWSGATLYDLASARLRACQGKPTTARPEGDDATGQESGASQGAASQGGTVLSDLFADDVSREMLIDALDQMHQPRDAFKFLYAVLQEHCKLVPEEAADYQVARLTLENVRRQQSQRVQEFYRGLAPG